MSIGDVLRVAVGGAPLTAAQMTDAMEQVLRGEATPVQIAALAVALRVRGETTTELAAAARVLRAHAVPLEHDLDAPLLDTCGTGGDGAGTFNISTASAIVVAAAGVKVAKHGNRAVSSQCGSADVLEALGVALDPTPAHAVASLGAHGIAFLFAPAFHGAMKYAGPVRRELGVRTFFNLLGPLANPANATHQLLGVYDPARLRTLAEVLSSLGVRGAWVVHGEGGLDEVSPAGPTRVAVLRGGQIEERTVTPETFGLEPIGLETLAGGDARANAAILESILAGDDHGPRRAVILNAAAALCAAEVEEDPRAAAERVCDAIDSGRARALLYAWSGR